MYVPGRNRSGSHRRRVKNQSTIGRSNFRERAKTRRAIPCRNPERSFDPPEDWHEATGSPGYRVIVRKPGIGYRHVVTAAQIRSRLARLPSQFLRDLEVVQLSGMTRKKHFSPLYGLQWSQAIYLYPFDETLDEVFHDPPPQAFICETKMYGGRWEHKSPNVWRLIWTESAARDFQLNNVLIHELGHLIDKRNTRYQDQERFAEWFAIEFGYRRTGGRNRRRPAQGVSRRHHRK